MSGPLLNASQPIVDDKGTMSQAFRTWTLSVSLEIPIYGTGSPEGVVTARLYQKYVDSTGTTGALEYRKMLPDIAGDKSQGWVAV